MTRLLPALLALALTLAGCVVPPGELEAPPKGKKVLFTVDQATPNPKQGGLAMRVESFTWHYRPETDQIQVTGMAFNATGSSQQAVRLVAYAYDQYGRLLGRAESYISPTYIHPDQEARFDFYVNSGAWVRNLKLVYHFEIRY